MISNFFFKAIYSVVCYVKPIKGVKMQSIEKVKELARSAALIELWACAWRLGPDEASIVVESTLNVLEKEEVL